MFVGNMVGITVITLGFSDDSLSHRTKTTCLFAFICIQYESNPISDKQVNCITVYMEVTWNTIPNRLVTKCFN